MPTPTPTTIVYDATIFSGKPGGLFPHCRPCVLTDRGTFRVAGGGPRDVNLGGLIDWARGLPPNPGPVILDLESEPLLDGIAVRTVKRARPDLRVGFYVGPEHWPAYRWGDIARLRQARPTPERLDAAHEADFVAVALYPRLDAGDNIVAFRTWCVRAIGMWEERGVPVAPIITGHLHAENTNDAVPDGVLTELFKAVAGRPEVILWDGTRLDAAGRHLKPMPFDPEGRVYEWRVKALAGA